MTHGERNNNPGNIRHVPGVVWQGQSAVQTDPAFVQFDDPIYGIRAIARIMKSYEKRGIDTLADAINRWAPPNENDSEAYVTDVCDRCGVNPDTRLDFSQVMPSLVKAIIHHENGEVIYTEDQINRGIALS